MEKIQQNASQKEMVNSKGDENLRLHTRVEKNGVSTTMKVSTKWPNEDYARVSCQRKERPQLVCQKRVSNRFVHLPRCALSSLLLAYKLGILFVLGDYVSFFFFFLVFLFFFPFYATMSTFVFGLTLSLSKGKCTMLRQTQIELLS